jgi:glycosyltransferase involved in cell wall biosynthesis
MAAFNRIILMSESIKRELSQKLSAGGQQHFETKARVVHNFIPLPDLQGPYQAPRGPATLFFIGNVGRQKGIHDLIEAAAQLRGAGHQFRVVLAGPFDSPAEGEQMKNRVAALGLSEAIQFTGPVFGAQKAALFQAADIFVLPSYGEGVPLSMLEAISYRLPVVATVVGGIPEILVHQEMGFLVEPGDVPGLTAALRNLLLSAELRTKMGRAGRERIEDSHSPARFLSSLGIIYQELTEAAAQVSRLRLSVPDTTQA